jgi:hypothetical protein
MKEPMQISGVLPHLSNRASAGKPRNESGIGALMTWADRLWFVSYVSHTGHGTGLYEIDQDLQMKKHPESVTGTYANRMIHPASDSVIVGPHIIDDHGSVTTIPALTEYRLASTMLHLEDPENRVYFLSMEGALLETELHTLRTTVLTDLADELGVTKVKLDSLKAAGTVKTDTDDAENPQPHFKAAHTANGKLIVANNTFSEFDFRGIHDAGRLSEWDGHSWNTIEKRPFNEVTGRRNWNQVVFATGWDRASAILQVYAGGAWTRYRLPKGSHTFDHFWQTEWPRIREVETERYLMDCHGLFYELSPVAFNDRVWGVKPISSHIRVIPDYCSYKGLLVLAGNQSTPIFDNNLITGYPESNLWFGKTDDLWSFGKPAGWGGPWWKEDVEPGAPSDPYLMTGFDKKTLHLANDSEGDCRVSVEVDFLGDGSWYPYDEIRVGGHAYVHHEFETGFSAHWVRVKSDSPCRLTAYFTYT